MGLENFKTQISIVLDKSRKNDTKPILWKPVFLVFFCFENGGRKRKKRKQNGRRRAEKQRFFFLVLAHPTRLDAFFSCRRRYGVPCAAETDQKLSGHDFRPGSRRNGARPNGMWQNRKIHAWICAAIAGKSAATGERKAFEWVMRFLSIIVLKKRWYTDARENKKRFTFR